MDQSAPFLNDVFEWPKGAITSYATTSDGIKIRTGIWAARKPTGTVFIFPGRADYLEKYGGIANNLLDRHLNVVTIDWRGQGLSERLLQDRNIGHVEDFKAYQNDVAVMINYANTAKLAKPWIMFAHSMGGLIGLRSLHNTSIFEKAVITSPMWGIEMPPILKSGAPIIMSLISLLGKMETYAPTTNSETRILNEDYESNKLTNDLQNFTLLGQQVEQYPDLQIGGPSTAWVSAALDEIEFQIGTGPPRTPALCFLAEEEEIIDTLAVITFCDSWDTCDLISIPKAKHDLLMEQNSILARLLSELDKFIKIN